MTNLSDILGGGGGGQSPYTAIVDAAGGGDYTSVVTAVNSETSGTIFIKDGTYAETSTINIKNGMYLVGESKVGTVITSNQSTMIDYSAKNTLTQFSPFTTAGIFDPAVGNGTASVTYNNTTVTLSQAVLAQTESGFIVLDGSAYTFNATPTTSTLTLDLPYKGKTDTNVPYSIHEGDPVSDGAGVSNLTLSAANTTPTKAFNLTDCANFVIKDIIHTTSSTSTGNGQFYFEDTFNIQISNIESTNMSTGTGFGMQGFVFNRQNTKTSVRNVALHHYAGYAVRFNTTSDSCHYLCDLHFTELSEGQNYRMLFFGRVCYSVIEAVKVTGGDQNGCINWQGSSMFYSTFKCNYVRGNTSGVAPVDFNGDGFGNILHAGIIENTAGVAALAWASSDATAGKANVIVSGTCLGSAYVNNTIVGGGFQADSYLGVSPQNNGWTF